jgi:hypothetical protein
MHIFLHPALSTIVVTLKPLETSVDHGETMSGAEVPNPYHSAVTIIIIVLQINIIIIMLGMVILPIIEDI